MLREKIAHIIKWKGYERTLSFRVTKNKQEFLNVHSIHPRLLNR